MARLFAIAGLLAALAPIAAGAQTDAARAVKELRIMVGSASGGGYDAYARLAAPFLGRHLPGNPAVVVQNIPGGGGLKLANTMAQIAPRDGSAIGITNRNLIAAQLLKMVEAGAAQYDPNELVWLANLNNDVSFLIMRAYLGVKNIDDLRKREFIAGAAGPTDNNGLFPHFFNNLLGARFKVVSGYPSSPELALALDRGEIDAVVGFSWASLKVQRPDWLRDKKVSLLVQFGLTPLPEQPDVPLVIDLARNETDRRALELMARLNTLGRPFFAPPRTSPEAVANLRKGFAALAKDEDFLAAAARQQFDVTFNDGESVQQTVRRINSAPPEVVEVVRRALEKSGASAP